MTTYNTYNHILEGVEESDAIECARQMVWSECEITEQTIAHAKHVETIDRVGVYYDYGADYYFFTDEE